MLTGGQDLLEIRLALQDAREGCSWGAPRPQLLPYRPFMGAGVQGRPLTDRALELIWLHCMFQWLSREEGYLKGLNLSSQSRRKKKKVILELRGNTLKTGTRILKELRTKAIATGLGN